MTVGFRVVRGARVMANVNLRLELKQESGNKKLQVPCKLFYPFQVVFGATPSLSLFLRSMCCLPVVVSPRRGMNAVFEGEDGGTQCSRGRQKSVDISVTACVRTNSFNQWIANYLALSGKEA